MWVNWWQKDCAISLLEVRVWVPKVMGWLGGWDGLPERDLRRDQNFDGLRWRFTD